MDGVKSVRARIGWGFCGPLSNPYCSRDWKTLKIRTVPQLSFLWHFAFKVPSIVSADHRLLSFLHKFRKSWLRDEDGRLSTMFSLLSTLFRVVAILLLCFLHSTSTLIRTSVLLLCSICWEVFSEPSFVTGRRFTALTSFFVCLNVYLIFLHVLDLSLSI